MDQVNHAKIKLLLILSVHVLVYALLLQVTFLKVACSTRLVLESLALYKALMVCVMTAALGFVSKT